MPQMAPLAWIYLFYFMLLTFSLVFVKLFFMPSYSVCKSTILTSNLAKHPGSFKLWEW